MYGSSERKERQHGFSLIELMIATIILLTGVIGIAGSLGTSIVGTKNSQDITKLVSAVRQKMEELKSQPFSSVSSGTDYVDANGTPQSTATGAAYSRTWTATVDSPMAGLKEITVSGSVLRPVGGARPLQLSARTYRAK